MQPGDLQTVGDFRNRGIGKFHSQQAVDQRGGGLGVGVRLTFCLRSARTPGLDLLQLVDVEQPPTIGTHGQQQGVLGTRG